MGGTDTGPSVLDWLVGDGELAQIVTNHLGLDLDLVEGLAVVDTDDGAGHFGDDDHVPQVGLDDVGLLVGRALPLLLTELLDEGHGLPLQSPGELPAHPTGEQLHQLLVGHVQQLVEVHAAVRELAESPPLLQLSGFLKTKTKSLHTSHLYMLD